MRTIFEMILVAAILWLLFDKIAPGTSLTLGASGLHFNEAPGSVGSGYISEGTAAPANASTRKSGGCGCGSMG